MIVVRSDFAQASSPKPSMASSVPAIGTFDRSEIAHGDRRRARVEAAHRILERHRLGHGVRQRAPLGQQELTRPASGHREACFRRQWNDVQRRRHRNLRRQDIAGLARLFTRRIGCLR